MGTKSSSSAASSILKRLSKALIALKDPNCPLTTVTVDQVTYTNADLQKKIETVIAPFQAVVDAAQVYDNALKARNAEVTDARAFTNAFFTALGVHLGADNAILSTYGGKPRKARAQRTSEQKAEAAAKVRATRAARHTLGKKQKAAIHGAVPAPAAGSSTTGTPTTGG